MVSQKSWAVVEVPTSSHTWTYVNSETERRYTAFALNDLFFAVGSRTGSITVLNRSSLDTLCSFNVTALGSTVTKLRFSVPENKPHAVVSTAGKTVNLNGKRDESSSQEIYLAIVSSGWKLEVWKLSASKNGMRDPLKLFPEIKRQSQVHNGSIVTDLCWNGTKEVYAGDKDGAISVVRVTSRGLMSASSQLMFKVKSAIVQIDVFGSILLASSKTSVALCNVSKQTVKEIPLEKDGNFGAILKAVDKGASFTDQTARESYLKAICAGPDAVIWVINVENYEVERTYCFKTHIQRFLKTSEIPKNSTQNQKTLGPGYENPVGSGEVNSEFDDVALLSVQQSANGAEPMSSAPESMNMLRLFSYGKGLIMGINSDGRGCTVIDVLNKSVLCAGHNFHTAHKILDVFVDHRSKKMTSFFETGDVRTYLVQQTHKILVTAVEEPLYTISCARLIVKNPTIATNYLNVEQLRTIAKLCCSEELKDIGKEISRLADQVIERRQSLFEMSGKSETEMEELLLREMETQKPKGVSVPKIGGLGMKNVLNKMKTTITDYEATVAERRIQKSQRVCAQEMIENQAEEFVAQIDPENYGCPVNIAAIDITRDGIERVIFAPQFPIEPPTMEPQHLPKVESLSLEEIPEISFEQEETDIVPDASVTPKQHVQKFKKFIQKVSTSVVENVEVLTRRPATEIEEQSLAVTEEQCLDLREMEFAVPVSCGRSSKVDSDLVTSIWLIDNTTDSVKLIVSDKSEGDRKRNPSKPGWVTQSSGENIFIKNKKRQKHKTKKKRGDKKNDMKKEDSLQIDPTDRLKTSSFTQSVSLPGSYTDQLEISIEERLSANVEINDKEPSENSKTEPRSETPDRGSCSSFSLAIESSSKHRSRSHSAAANNEEEKFKTMQYTFSSSEDNFEAFYRSELGYLRIIRSTNQEAAMKIWNGTGQYLKSDLSSNWKCLMTISSQWPTTANKAHTLLDLNEEFHHMKLLGVLSEFNQELIVDWLSNALISMNSQMRPLSVGLIQSLQTYDWPNPDIRKLLLALLKSLTEKMKPKEDSPITAFCPLCGKQRASITWGNASLLRIMKKLILFYDSSLDSINLGHFTTEDGQIDCLGYLEFLSGSNQIEKRMKFCVRSLKNLEKVRQEVAKIIDESHGVETLNQETLWMMAVDISLAQESENLNICSCSESDTEQNHSANSKFTFTELLLLEYCKDKSIRNANTFVQRCIQYRSGKPVPLSYRFFCFLVMQETKMSRQKLKLYSQFKNADRELWKRRGEYSRERTTESRSLSLDYFNPQMEEFMWCERVDILELECAACHGTLITSEGGITLYFFQCGHAVHSTCWENTELCPFQNCDTNNSPSIPIY